jgi:hypothetical protein
VAGAGSANGTAVQLHTCHGTAAQSWTTGNSGKFLVAAPTGVIVTNPGYNLMWAFFQQYHL